MPLPGHLPAMLRNARRAGRYARPPSASPQANAGRAQALAGGRFVMRLRLPRCGALRGLSSLYLHVTSTVNRFPNSGTRKTGFVTITLTEILKKYMYGDDVWCLTTALLRSRVEHIAPSVRACRGSIYPPARWRAGRTRNDGRHKCLSRPKGRPYKDLKRKLLYYEHIAPSVRT